MLLRPYVPQPAASWYGFRRLNEARAKKGEEWACLGEERKLQLFRALPCSVHMVSF